MIHGNETFISVGCQINTAYCYFLAYFFKHVFVSSMKAKYIFKALHLMNTLGILNFQEVANQMMVLVFAV